MAVAGEAKGPKQINGQPNMITGPVQICWHKFARYWDVELREIPMEGQRLLMTFEEVLKRCDENTIGVVPTLGVTSRASVHEHLTWPVVRRLLVISEIAVADNHPAGHLTPVAHQDRRRRKPSIPRAKVTSTNEPGSGTKLVTWI